ncbi:MAG: hypothetical protein R2764_02315 [Bacteroidales bacterium]
MNDIPTQFELTPTEAEAHLQYTTFYSLLSGIVQEGKTLEADSTQIALLFDIEASEADKVSAYAKEHIAGIK